MPRCRRLPLRVRSPCGAVYPEPALQGLVDTGILLNGFPDSQRGTNTISGVPNNAAQTLTALKAENQLEGSIFDLIPGEDFVRILADADTILEITCATVEAGVPFPIKQDLDQGAESGEVDQTFTVTQTALSAVSGQREQKADS